MIKSQLELVEKKGWRELYRAKDGTYWRLDAVDKNQTRYMLRVDDLDTWWEFDATELEKNLLRESRGESADRLCRWKGCSNPALLKMEICAEHAFQYGLRE